MLLAFLQKMLSNVEMRTYEIKNIIEYAEFVVTCGNSIITDIEGHSNFYLMDAI